PQRPLVDSRLRPTSRPFLSRDLSRLPTVLFVRPSVACHPKLARDPRERRMERETGIEPATNSLEGCDSTTELLPPSRSRFPFCFDASARQAPCSRPGSRPNRRLVPGLPSRSPPSLSLGPAGEPE